MNVFTTHIRPQLEYGSCLWNMGFVGDIQLIERIQRRWTKAVNGFGNLDYGRRLKELDLYSAYGRLLRADLVQVWKMFNGESPINPLNLFEPCQNQATRGHKYKLQVCRARLDIKKRFFSHRIVSRWNALSAEAVEATSIKTFKSFLHRDLGAELYKYL